MKKDYCSHSPESIHGTDLSRCCKKHDNMVGQRGTYNPFTPHIVFFKCLRKTGLSMSWVLLYTVGGLFFSWLKYPYLAYKIYKYRNKK